jgi:hypothetical protein
VPFEGQAQQQPDHKPMFGYRLERLVAAHEVA